MLRKGFTLIELLVVIAIIAILAAIIFPVFAQVKASAYRSGDLSNMNALRAALQLYRQDQGGYPPALLGYVTQYIAGDPNNTNGGPNPTAGDMLPANMVVGALYPKRVDSLNTFQPAYDRSTSGGSINLQFNTATWPNRAGAGGANQPGQKYGPTDMNFLGTNTVLRCVPGQATPQVPNYYYTVSGFDAATVPNETGGGTRVEIHYSPFWSGYTVADDPCVTTNFQGNSGDSTNQLGYFDPPENTVVTWDSYFRDYDALHSGPAHQEGHRPIPRRLRKALRLRDFGSQFLGGKPVGQEVA